MSYSMCIRAGWKAGIHDCRSLRYQHPWLVIHDGYAVGCWSRAQARRVLRRLKAGYPAEVANA